jgi:rhodanese-related sulfurtransferase
MNVLSSFLSVFSPPASGVRSIEPQEAARLVRARQAVLVDVREPAEWSGGVAADAALLPLSDLTGARREWRPFLEQVAGREIILYCHSGARCRLVGRVLAGEGFKAATVGSLHAWQSAGLPVVRPGPAR